MMAAVPVEVLRLPRHVSCVLVFLVGVVGSENGQFLVLAFLCFFTGFVTVTVLLVCH